MLSSHLRPSLPCSLFLSRFLTKILYAFIISSMRGRSTSIAAWLPVCWCILWLCFHPSLSNLHSMAANDINGHFCQNDVTIRQFLHTVFNTGTIWRRRRSFFLHSAQVSEHDLFLLRKFIWDPMKKNMLQFWILTLNSFECVLLFILCTKWK